MTARAHARRSGSASGLLTAVDLAMLKALAVHRVLTTRQVADAVDVAERTAQYRLDRLRRRRLVAQKRPYAPSGSAPLHWWLTTAGRDRAGCPGRVRHNGNPMFLAHTAATAAVPLALERHGAQTGLPLRRWLRDRDAWRSWERPSASLFWDAESPPTLTLSPDGLAVVTRHGIEVPLLVEVDRSTMSGRQMTDKALRYLRYAADRAWQPDLPRCPLLLVATTGRGRADGLLRVLDRAREQVPETLRHDDLLAAAAPVVTDARAGVVEATWRTEPGGPRRRLVELVDERLRVEAESAAETWPPKVVTYWS